MCDTKTCTKCNIKRPLSDFRYRADRGNYVNPCKICTLKQDKKRKPRRRDSIYVDDKKFCARCNQFKEYEEFRFLNTTKKGLNNYDTYCKKCTYKKTVAQRSKKFDNLGLTAEELEQRFKEFGSKCEICEAIVDTTSKKSIAIDHNHVTGKFRGFLCSRCNVALGMMKDNVDILAKAITYLNERK